MKSSTVVNRSAVAEPPDSIRNFVATWKTVPLQEMWPDSLVSQAELIYSQYWYRAVAAMALSGRFAATDAGRVNKTEGLRLCKEANFNPAWLDELVWFLFQADVLRVEYRRRFAEGETFDAFDRLDFEPLRAAVQKGVVRLVQEQTGNRVTRPTNADSARLIEFVTLFAAAFSGVAVRESDLLKLWQGLSQLPVQELVDWAKRLGLTLTARDVASWKPWLDFKGEAALRGAMYDSRWAYGTSHQNDIWFGVSFDAASVLGLVEPLPKQSLTDELQVDEQGHLRVGAGLPIHTLARLYRLCKPIKVRAVLEFQIDKKRLAQLPPSESPVDELRELLRPASPLSNQVEKLLGGTTKLGGRLQFAQCSGIVIPESDAVAKAIRQHPRLKGYLATNAPPGLLLIKPESDPGNFLTRCRELGFEVTWR